MSWLEIFRFRRTPPIRDLRALADFIDENSAFLIQKALYEYSRARAGHYAKVLFSEPGFGQAVERARWRAYPLGLAMVAAVADNVLHSTSVANRSRDLETLKSIVLSVFDRYPVSPAVGEPTWKAMRADLDQRLQRIVLHPPKRAIDIPDPFAKAYFDLMPIHENLRGRDFPTTLNYLKVTLANISDEMSKRLDLPVVMEALQADAAPVRS